MGAVGAAGHEIDYEEFYAQWVAKQQVTIQELQHALNANLNEDDLQQIVQKAHSLYEAYYDAIDASVQQDVLQVISPLWKTPLEKAFMWFGEWRPSAAYQLVYALAGQKVEEELSELLNGIETPSLASLSPSQLAEIHSMQMWTMEEEDRVRHHVEALQRSVVDRPMLSLAQAADQNNIGFAGRIERGEEDEDGKLFAEEQQRGRASCTHDHRNEGASTEEIGRNGQDELRRGGDDELLETAVCEKLKQLEELSLTADSLRRRTLTGLLQALNTVQRAQFLLASSQLHVAIRSAGQRLRHTSQQQVFL